MDLGLKGKVALVTGASRGIGLASARNLAQEGCDVAICARGRVALDSAADEMRRASGGRIAPIVADLSLKEDIDRLVAETATKFGGVDILVAIAGGPLRGTFSELSDEQYEEAFRTTAVSVVRLIRAVLPHMRKNGWGRVVTVQSHTAKHVNPEFTLSNAVRPGVAGLIKAASAEFAHEGILFNSVLPGRILTERFREGAARAGLSFEDYAKKAAADLPIRRLGTAEEVAHAVTFLCSAGASYITGVALPVDGGYIKSIV